MNSETDIDRGCGGCNKVCEKSYDIVASGQKWQAERGAKVGTLLPSLDLQLNHAVKPQNIHTSSTPS
jgi:hypothetical protein